MSNNNYCEYYQGNLCVGPDGKSRACSVDIENLYGRYTKENAIRMCARKQEWDNKKERLETKLK